MEMKRRFKRMKMFKKCSLRKYESFVWKMNRGEKIFATDLPFFLKRQAE